ncbi:MAG: hypothetical protein AAF597_02905, partial [Bacteroidota bacterium]
MNRYFFVGLLLVLGLSLHAQTYYVAAIKGKVSYRDKLLKKRDKIRIEGQLTFGSKDDWVKVAGPGGIYTLKPEKPSGSGSEFFTALREELFPKIRLRGSFANGAIWDASEPLCLGISTMANYFHGKKVKLPDVLFGHERDIRYVFVVDGRVEILSVKIKKGALILHEKYWKEVEARSYVDHDYRKSRLDVGASAVVVVNDWVRFEAARDTARNFAQMGFDEISCSALDITPLEYNDPAQRAADSLRISTYAYPLQALPNATATLLNFFYPESMLDRKVFERDIRFLIKKTQTKDADDFLRTMKFDDYISENNG